MRRIFFILLLFAGFLNVQAQTNNSPYSIIGIGDMEDSYFDRTNGLANTGIAYRQGRSLICANPASYSGLDNQYFIGDIGIRAKYVQYTGNAVDPSNNTSTDITFRRFAIGTKIFKHLGTSMGLMPLTSENFEFHAPQAILGTINETANAYYQGYGGINRVYWTNSYEFFHHVSIGVNSSYLFGSISQKTILQNPSVSTAYVSTNKGTYYTGLYFDYGVQFFGSLGKSMDFTLGATFAPKTMLNAQQTIVILGIDSSTLKSETLNESLYSLPTSYGIGAALTLKKKYTLLADYKVQQWADLNYGGYNYALQNSSRASIGFEISNKKNIYNQMVEFSYLHVGLYYNNTYMNVFGRQIEDRGITMGFGINAKRSPLAYAVTFQYGVRGTTVDNLLRENYFNVSFLFSYRDFWFTKGKKFN